jgi:hypothetical protein
MLPSPPVAAENKAKMLWRRNVNLQTEASANRRISFTTLRNLPAVHLATQKSIQFPTPVFLSCDNQTTATCREYSR